MLAFRMAGKSKPIQAAALLLAILLGGFARADTKIFTKDDLKGFPELSEPRRKLLETALETAKEVRGMKYKFGGNGASDGGFDCSGAMYHILRKSGLKPPRTSFEQYLWIKKNSKFHPVSTTAADLTDKSLSELKPGDLVFWSGTYTPTDGRAENITHVGMFLGYEKSDGWPVIINSTNGRSYRGVKGNGYGVFDFRIPRKGGKSKIVGYGTPPGLMPDTPAKPPEKETGQN